MIHQVILPEDFILPTSFPCKFRHNDSNIVLVKQEGPILPEQSILLLRTSDTPREEIETVCSLLDGQCAQYHVIVWALDKEAASLRSMYSGLKNVKVVATFNRKVSFEVIISCYLKVVFPSEPLLRVEIPQPALKTPQPQSQPQPQPQPQPQAALQTLERPPYRQAELGTLSRVQKNATDYLLVGLFFTVAHVRLIFGKKSYPNLG